MAALACDNGTSSPAAEPSLSQPALQPQPQELPERISIRSVQAAWKVSEETISVERTPQGFIARSGPAKERPVEEALVWALLRASAAPLEPVLNPERLRPLIGDLRAEAERAKLPPLTAKHFAARALEPANLAEIMKRAEAVRVSDDYPSLELEITWASGSRLKLSSNSQHPLMLPWAVNGSSVTWNPDLSRAIAALMPEGAMNRQRVAGAILTGVIAWHGRQLLAKEIGGMQADERFSGKLEPLRRRFRIEDGGVEHKFRLNTHSADTVWCGKLFGERDAQFGFSLCLSAKGELASFDPFLRDADALLARARKVPWLRRFAAENSSAKILIEYLDDSSLSQYARGTTLSYAKDLYKNSELATLTDEELRRSLGITIAIPENERNETGTWIVLPDGRGLFKYGKPFGAAEPELQPGRLIQPDGTGGVSDTDREAAARRAGQAERAAEFQKQVDRLEGSVRSGFLQTAERLKQGNLSEADKRALSAPFSAKPSAEPTP